MGYIILSIHFYVSITKDLQRDTRDGWQLWHDDLKAVSRKSLALHYQLCQNMGASLLCHFSEAQLKCMALPYFAKNAHNQFSTAY